MRSADRIVFVMLTISVLTPHILRAEGDPRRARIGVYSDVGAPFLIDGLRSGGYDVSYLRASPPSRPPLAIANPGPARPVLRPSPLPPEDLSRYDLILLGSGDGDYSPEGIRALVKYVEGGGSALIVPSANREASMLPPPGGGAPDRIALDRAPDRSLSPGEAFGVYFTPALQWPTPQLALQWAKHPLAANAPSSVSARACVGTARCPDTATGLAWALVPGTRTRGALLMGTFARGKGQVVFVGSYDLLGHPFGPQIVTWLASRPPEPGAPAGAETKRLKPVPVPQSTDPAPADREGYAALAAEAGRDADAHVRLALWCEARGMEVAYREHLRMAVDIAPDHPTARGLLHQLADGARWQTIEDAADRSRGDRALSKALDEYDGRRRAARDTADDQWKLAVWCEENHLPAEARAHYTVVTRLAPNRSEAWLKLGYKRYESRWLTPEQIAAERAEARAQREADAYWQPRIESLAKRYFGGEKDTAELLRNAGEITDPRAVPAIWRAFAGKKAGPKRQEGAARLLAQIESPVATQRLTALAVFGQTPRARVAATEVLRRRDPRDYVETLISLLYSPLKYQLRLPSIDDRTSALEIEGELYTLRRIFVPVRGTDSDVTAVAQGAATAVRAHNALLRLVNAPALTLLSDTTEQYLGPDKEQWQKWWAEQKGYAYVRPKTKPVYTIVQRVTAPPRVSHSCFGAGTPVRTPTGLRPIEELQVGDQVLSQDVQTGALSFRPIVAVFHNPPNQTVRVGLGKENIVATPIHRFWKAGAGWVMARDLKVGDTIRTLQGRERVVSLESGEVVPVFNLEVSDGRNFFVGQQGALVHDNTLVEAVPQPFDAASVAVAGKTGSAH